MIQVAPTTTAKMVVATAVATTTVSLFLFHFSGGTAFFQTYSKLLSALGLSVSSLLASQLRQPWLRRSRRGAIFLEAPDPRRATNNNNDECDNNTKEEVVDEVLLVILPDDKAPAEAYLSLAEAIQKQAAATIHTHPKIRLHVGIARFFFNRPGWLAEGDREANLAVLAERAGHPDHVFVLTHGKSTRTALKAVRYTGLIRFGYINDDRTANSSSSSSSSSSLYSFPVPCLTLLGDRDKHVPHLGLASILEDLDRAGSHHHLKQSTDIPIPKPIIILPDLNHVCLVDSITKAKAYMRAQNDFAMTNAKSPQDARDHVAFLSVDFIHSVVQPNCGHDQQIAQLEKDTRQRLEPYQKLLDPKAVADYAAHVQKSIFRGGVKEESSSQSQSKLDVPFTVTVQFHSSVADFAFSKPSILTSNACVRVHVFDQGPLMMENGKVLLSSGTLAIKCKSKAALEQSFGNTDQAVKSDDEVDRLLDVFQGITQATFQYILDNVVSPSERQRYLESQEASQLKIEQDVQLLTRNWLLSDVQIKIVNSQRRRRQDGKNSCCYYSVSTPVTITSMSDNLSKRFQGMHYAKLLSPAQCYEWIVSARCRGDSGSEVNLSM